jgi:hypothetical protein
MAASVAFWRIRCSLSGGFSRLHLCLHLQIADWSLPLPHSWQVMRSFSMRPVFAVIRFGAGCSMEGQSPF